MHRATISGACKFEFKTSCKFALCNLVQNILLDCFIIKSKTIALLHVTLSIVNGLARRALLRCTCLEKKAARATSKKFRPVTSVNMLHRIKGYWAVGGAPALSLSFHRIFIRVK